MRSADPPGDDISRQVAARLDRLIDLLEADRRDLAGSTAIDPQKLAHGQAALADTIEATKKLRREMSGEG